MGVFWGGSTINQPNIVANVWTGILTLLSQGKLKATVFEKVYEGLESIPAALSSLGSRETWGKVKQVNVILGCYSNNEKKRLKALSTFITLTAFARIDFLFLRGPRTRTSWDKINSFLNLLLRSRCVLGRGDCMW
jgi:hypothetical protein